MRALIALVIAAVAMAAAVSVASPAEAQKRPTCDPEGARTLAAKGPIRIFEVRRRPGRKLAGYYACMAGRRPVSIPGYLTLDAGVGAFQIVGDRVGYVFDDCDRYSAGQQGCTAEVVVVDARTRRVRRSVIADHGGAGSLVLSQSGTAALMVGQHSGERPNPARLLLMRDTTLEEIDSGNDLDTSSLALGGRTLYWLKAGQPKTLELP